MFDDNKINDRFQQITMSYANCNDNENFEIDFNGTSGTKKLTIEVINYNKQEFQSEFSVNSQNNIYKMEIIKGPFIENNSTISQNSTLLVDCP